MNRLISFFLSMGLGFACSPIVKYADTTRVTINSEEINYKDSSVSIILEEFKTYIYEQNVKVLESQAIRKVKQVKTANDAAKHFNYFKNFKNVSVVGLSGKTIIDCEMSDIELPSDVIGIEKQVVKSRIEKVCEEYSAFTEVGPSTEVVLFRVDFKRPILGLDKFRLIANDSIFVFDSTYTYIPAIQNWQGSNCLHPIDLSYSSHLVGWSDIGDLQKYFSINKEGQVSDEDYIKYDYYTNIKEGLHSVRYKNGFSVEDSNFYYVSNYEYNDLELDYLEVISVEIVPTQKLKSFLDKELNWNIFNAKGVLIRSINANEALNLNVGRYYIQNGKNGNIRLLIVE